MKDVLVSVIIPVFNVCLYLREALDSVINQTYKNLEIIIVDDGSSDGSEYICDEYAKSDDRIKVIHQNNQGLSAARNTGLELFSGDCVAFLDSDDAYSNRYIESMVNAMLLEKADLVVCQYKMLKTDDSLLINDSDICNANTNRENICRKEALRALAENRIFTAGWNKLYKRKSWEHNRFHEGHVYEDAELAFRIIDTCKTVCIIDEVLYFYRIRGGSIRSNLSNSSINDLLLAYFKIDCFISNNIPEVFNTECLQKKRETQFVSLVLIYFNLANSNEGNNKEVCKELRNRIKKFRYSISLKHCSFKIQLRYWIVIVCPWIIRLLYPVYHSFS